MIIHALNKRDHLIALCLVVIISIIFGNWFAWQQVNVVAERLISTYPQMFYLQTILKTGLTVSIFCLFSLLVLSKITNNKLSNIYVALTFSPLLLVHFQFSIIYLCLTIFLLQVIGVFSVLKSEDYCRLKSDYLSDVMILTILIICHLLFTTRFSPLHWKMAMLVGDGYSTEEIPVLMPLYRGYLLAKQFSFSYVDPANWTGIMNPPVTLASPLMQVLEFILDLPSLSIESFHVLYSAIYFFMAVFGSFGFYLFLHYGGKLNKLFSFYGGLLYFFSGAPVLSQMFTADGGIFLSPYVIFPYAILLISRAFEVNSIIYAAWSGVFLAAQFFVMTPHPEGTLYSCLFFGIFSCGLALFNKDISLKRGVLLITIATASFLCLSAYAYVPILADRLSGNMYVFAHSGDVAASDLSDIKLYIYVGIVAALVYWAALKILNQCYSAVYLSSLFLSCAILAFLLLTSNAHFNKFMVSVLHVGLHFSYTWRISMYFCLSVFILLMFALHEVTHVLCLSFTFLRSRLGNLVYENK